MDTQHSEASAVAGARELPTAALAFRLRCDLRPGDIGAVMLLHGREFLAEFGFGVRFEGYLAEGLGRFVHQYRPELDRMWMAEDDSGRTVGTITVAHFSETEAQIRWFVVDAAARGCGIGKALLGEALAFARRTGYKSLFLWTIDDLSAALHLYREAGFSLAEEKPNADWAGRTVMEQRYVLNL